MLDNRVGLIQYVGWFQHQEKNDDNSSSWYHTIILEYAETDLYKMFRDKSPPVFPCEMKGFWEGMLEVCQGVQSIHHNLKKDGIQFNASVNLNCSESSKMLLTMFRWHGDIKPENILRVNGVFKLADHGEARYEVATNSEYVARTNVSGGTRTYGKSRFILTYLVFIIL